MLKVSAWTFQTSELAPLRRGLFYERVCRTAVVGEIPHLATKRCKPTKPSLSHGPPRLSVKRIWRASTTTSGHVVKLLAYRLLAGAVNDGGIGNVEA